MSKGYITNRGTDYKLSGTEAKILLRKQGMLVMDASEDHLTMDTRAMIHAVNTDLVVTLGGMTT
jgi:hypothetical protein